MSGTKPWAAPLLQAPRKRDIAISDDATRAINSARDGPQVAHWISDNLIDSTPSTAAEYAQRQSLKTSGRGSSDGGEGGSIILPSTDEEFRAAIDALNSSTRAIERRTKVLNAQINHAKHLASTQNAVDGRKAGHVYRVCKRQAAEVQHLKFANDQLFESLRATLRAELDRVAKDVKSVPTIVSAVLNSDDRALAELNDFSSSARGKQETSVDVDALQNRVNKLTRALQHFRAEAVKDRLDRTYLESLSTADNPSDAQAGSDASPEAVEEDLGSLYREIDAVVTMVVAQEHGNALDAAVQNIRTTQMQNERVFNEKVYGKLCSLTEALENLSTRVENLQDQRHKLHNLNTQITPLEDDAHSPTHPSQLLARSKYKDIGPAARALLQHLNIPSNSDDTSKTAVLSAQLDDLTQSLEQQSSESIAKVLQISVQAATKRHAILESVSDALKTNDAHVLALRALEESVAAAKGKIEGATVRQ